MGSYVLNEEKHDDITKFESFIDWQSIAQECGDASSVQSIEQEVKVCMTSSHKPMLMKTPELVTLAPTDPAIPMLERKIKTITPISQDIGTVVQHFLAKMHHKTTSSNPVSSIKRCLFKLAGNVHQRQN